MFNFFNRKVFLADYLHGLVDIHNHILPGIDDGAKTVDESLSLIKAFAAYGVTNFVFTPHIMNHYYPNTPDSIRTSFELLQSELEKQDVENVKIDYAAEHMIDDEFEPLLENNGVVPLKTEHLLVEMSYLQPAFGFDSAVKKIFEQKYFPILAHPERYSYFHQQPQIYSELKSNGVQLQLNLLSVSGYYGSEIQRIALKLLDDELYDYCASDAHHIRHITALKEINVSQKVLSKILPVIENTIQTFY
ncbi:tyrosine-protein phosphatase [Flagellimonas flava]|uniref:tyrosine-protein phosphatase n=1 Tax=Flagellimonas flava TaxID=570519 RepID=UPI003D64F6AE